MKRFKTILMVAYTNYSTDPRVMREAEALIKNHFEVDFLNLRRSGDKKNEVINGVNVIHLNQKRYRGSSSILYVLTYLLFFLKVFIFVSKRFKKYKIVHVNNMPDFLVFACIIPKIFGAKVVLDIHDPMPATYKTKFGLPVESLLYKFLLFEEKISAKFANSVITVHEPIKFYVLIKDGIPEEKIEVIANFADENKFGFIANYEFEDQIKMVFHGTIAERFGFGYVLQELARIKELDFTFTIIGEGDYSTKLSELISKHDLNDKVKFDNQFYPVDKLPNILSKYNLGLVSYELSEATNYMLPLKYLEYISLGLPSLCVMNKALSYYFTTEDAFFFSSNLEGSLSKKIGEIIKDRDLLMVKRKRISTIREKYLWGTQAEKYCSLIKYLIEE